MTIFNTDPLVATQVRNLVTAERQKSLSTREWKHRLAGYGYLVEDTLHGEVIKTLRHGEPVCMLGA
ncbi:hypothetical protein [Algirhabdus cladophorae]|uniref:hypothetical protein n=1 Tax=Algirhabdus cladophorae TaxID=3377108 RepID=UPI003B84802C